MCVYICIYSCKETLPSKNKLLLAVLENRYEEKSLSHVIALYTFPGAVLICSSKPTHLGRQCNWTHHVTKFMLVILQDPPDFFWVKWSQDGYHYHSYLNILMAVLISAGTQFCFWVTVLIGRRHSRCFHLALQWNALPKAIRWRHHTQSFQQIVLKQLDIQMQK